MEIRLFDESAALPDVPPETWAGIDPRAVVNFMMDLVPEEEREGLADLGLRALASRVRILSPSDETRARLTRLAPSYLQFLDRLQARQALEP